MRRSPLIAAAVFLVLLALTLWLLRDGKVPEPEPFFALKRRLPDTLLVAFAGDTTVLVPGGEGWRVVRPVAYPADALVVEAILKRLTGLEVAARYPLTREKMDTYGFRSPRGLIRASYREGIPPDTLWIGAFTLDDAYDYVRAGSSSVAGLLEERVSRGYLLKRTLDLRDTRLLPFHESRARSFRLLGAHQAVRVEVEKGEDETWKILRPYPGPADPGKVREYLASAAHMHVRSFVREGGGSLAPYGLEDPSLGLQVITQNGDELGVFVGAPIPGTDLVHAVTLARPHVFGVSNKYVPFLAKPADAFRRREVLAFGLADIDSVVVDGGTGTWGFRPDALSREDRDVLGNWVRLQASGFVPAEDAALRDRGFRPPEGRVSWLNRSEPQAVVEIGAVRNGERSLRIASGAHARPDEILLVKEEDIGPLWRRLAASSGTGS